MNKTVNINLGGWFFHIDEDAYENLSNYLQAVKHSLKDPESQDEIMKDIELRMAELLTAKSNNANQVINTAQIEELIRIMGQPEVYSVDSDESSSQSATGETYSGSQRQNTAKRPSKKLYRDPDQTVVSGVCSGLGHYLGIDPVWLRILFLGSVLLSFGSMLIVYIVLWICVPEAKTTTEKLEMTGQPVNISNIEKKVKEDFNAVADRIKNVDYDQIGKNINDNVNRGVKTATENINRAGKGLGKFFGAIVVAISSILLIAMIIALFVLTKLSYEGNWNEVIYPDNFTGIPLWGLMTIAFIIGFIPLLRLWIVGLRMLNPHMKPLNVYIRIALNSLWILAVIAAIYLGVLQGAEFNNDNKVIVRHELNLQPNDTLRIHWNHNSEFTHSIQEFNRYKIIVKDGKDEIFSNRVNVHFKPSLQGDAYLQIERKADGTNLKSSLHRAEKINYDWTFENNQLKLNNFYTTPIDARFANQKVNVYIYLPKGVLFKADYTLDESNDSDSDYFEMDAEAKYYQVGELKINTITLPTADWDTVQNLANPTTTTETNQPIDAPQPTTTSPDNSKGRLMLGPDGTLIKNN